ncbi:MAG TPA: type II CRISPR RNA-guided endonuclease Cas9 [Prolixibacteraceae bacterium]|nr:type II CRISPR RNA-guided endonuclease Cas9 [Prolixibacteraceae bacterium]
MKKILGLDLGTASIGWAFVNEAESENEKSSIVKLGVRVNPLTVDEQANFEKGKSITTNADRTLKRSMRRNLQRYKQRKENLIELLKQHIFISDETILSENGNKTTFETYRLRAKAVNRKVSLEEFSRILLMINKKRGYKSSRKAKSNDEGQLIDGMEIAKKLYHENITPGQLILELLKENKKYLPDFYRSDLQTEFELIWNFQKQFFPKILTDDLKKQLVGKGKLNTTKIFLARFGIYTAENKGVDKKLQAAQWRVDALSKEISTEELAFVISDLNGNVNNSSGYLGAISDRSKELYFKKQTVGQYLMAQLDENPHTRLKNQVFYRQDYLDEFNTLWEAQAGFHKELTPELKSEIRDVIIFFQRRLKSQKGLISFCEFENRQVEVEVDGIKKVKTVGLRVCPKSSPLFQEFKTWQILNNIQVKEKTSQAERLLEQDEKETLFAELTIKDRLSKAEALKLLYKNHRDLDFNYKDIEGNRTQAALFAAYNTIVELSGHNKIDFAKLTANEVVDTIETIFKSLGINTGILRFDSTLSNPEFGKQAMFQLWHLLYSFEGDNSNTGHEKLIEKLQEKFGFEREYANVLINITLQPDYGSLCTKAIRKILPHLREGNEFSVACFHAGYRHSKSSLTSAELDQKKLKDKLDILPKNSLRNPVVEKILNQMINVINTVIDEYGKPDEIRIELARELKKSAKERESLTNAINQSTTEHEKYREILRRDFGLSHISRNDIIRYKLYLELELNGFKTLYSNTYIAPNKLFSGDFDIEHIIPQSRLFDDSFSNKTIEARSVNLEKGNETAYDYLLNKLGEEGVDEYIGCIERVFKNNPLKQGKLKKLKMKGEDIPDGFINRDLRDTQYIAKKAKSILEELVREVISTTGSITNRLREDWQLINVMQELNWDKYYALGMTEIIQNRDGKDVKRIKDWTKRNDHRHHAMDALTIAFTKRSHIQYLNNLNARSDKAGSIYGIEVKELNRDDRGKLKFNPPMPLDEFRVEAKRQLENTLISIKAKNKVTTININTTKKSRGLNKKKQLTPRGQLHLETVYGSIQQTIIKEEKVNGSFNEELIAKVTRPIYREALLKRLKENNNDPKKAFTGKNTLEKNPIYLNELHTQQVPEKVKTNSVETIYTIRKDISPDLKIDKVIDLKVKSVLQARLDAFNGDSKKAFTDLELNPIWLNEAKGISIKRVTITGISNALPLHDKKDKEGNLILDTDGKPQPVDFVNTGNNHHVAIYRDEKGNLQENVISFFEATERVNQGLSVIDKTFKEKEGWEFLFSMKQNEYFVFPNEKTGFNPGEINLLDSENYNLISPNLYKVQTMSKVFYGTSIIRDYKFRHHLETTVKDVKELKDVTYKQYKTLVFCNDVVKVRINHIGQIVSVGEY